MCESVDSSIISNSWRASDDSTINNNSVNGGIISALTDMVSYTNSMWVSDKPCYCDNNGSVARMKFELHMKITRTAAAVKCT
jgi:hypothetical protein